MTIRAILRQGMIQPTEPLPKSWAEGKELVIEETPAPSADAEIDQWAREMDDAISKVPPDEHERFWNALIEIEKESKEIVRQQWQNEEGQTR